MEIVRARPEQADALTQISIAAKSHWGYSDKLIHDWKTSLSMSSRSIESHPTFVAVCDGQLAGFYQLSTDRSLVRLEHLWVHPIHMRKGIGRALLTHALNNARATITIDSDPHAEAFYIACGARRVGCSPAPIPGQSSRFLPKMELRYVAI